MRIYISGFGRNAKLLIIGLDNAGKSTLLNCLSDGRLLQNSPTFQGRSTKFDLGGLRFTAYDLGGNQGVRRVERFYIPGVDGVIFMVDCADADRFDEVRAELDSLIRDQKIADIPIAIMFNKIDRPKAVDEEFLCQKLRLGAVTTGKKHVTKTSLPGRPVETFPCSILRRQGYGEAIRWLGHYID